MPLPTNWIAEAWVERFGWQVAEGSMLHRRLLKVVGRGQIEAAHRQRQDLEGQPRQVIGQMFAPEQYRLDAERKRCRRVDASISIPGLSGQHVAGHQPVTDLCNAVSLRYAVPSGART